jgi:hypothetical protein
MDVAVKRIRNFGIDLAAKPGQAAERGLDMPAGTAEAVVQIKVTEGGIEIVEPHQPDHAPAEPDAFRISRRPVDRLRSLGEFIRLVLIVFLGVCGILLRFGLLIRGMGIAALGGRVSNTNQEGKSGDGEMAENRILKLKHPSTHKFPNSLTCPVTRKAGF